MTPVSSIPKTNGFYTDESQGLVYYMQRRAGRSAIYCLDIATLEKSRWEEIVLPADVVSWYLGQGLLFVNTADTLYLYGAADGSLRATHKVAYHCSGGGFFIAEARSGQGVELVCVDSASGAVRWRIPDFPISSVTCAAAHVLALLKEDRPRNLFGYDGDTGKKKWEADVSGYGTVKPNPFWPEEPCSVDGELLVYQNWVALPLSIGKLLVLNVASGQQHALIPDVASSVSLASDGLVYELTPERYGVVDLSEGKYKLIKQDWSKRDKEVWATALTKFSVSGDHLYVCTNGGVLVALRKTTGDIVAKQKIALSKDGFIPLTYSPASIGGRVMIMDHEGTLHVYTTA